EISPSFSLAPHFFCLTISPNRTTDIDRHFRSWNIEYPHMVSTWWRALLKRNAKTAHTASGNLRPKFFRQMYFERLEDRTLPSTFQRVGTSSLNWNDPGNWTGGNGTFPNAQGDVAQFTGSYSAAQTVIVNQAITVGEIDFGSSKNITITASGGNI